MKKAKTPSRGSWRVLLGSALEKGAEPFLRWKSFQIPFDWRGWIALAWALWWGWAYCTMAVAARGPQVLEWIHSFAK
jgi:hypothetical protein